MNKILAIMILFGILPLPYDYYPFLRVVVSLGCIYFLAVNWKNINNHHRTMLSFLIALFNPFFPVYLSKLIWAPIDLAAGIYLFMLPERIEA